MGNIMENGNPGNASALIPLLIFTIPIILWYLVYLWMLAEKRLNNVGNLDTNKKYLSKYTYINKDKKEQYLKENRQVKRERPPNASFFCRVDGKETFLEGPYEEQFLTKIEKIKWECKKRMREGRTKL